MGYIKREDAIETIREYLDPSNERTVDGVCFNDGLDLAITLLSKMPAADVVERKRGKWLDKTLIHKFTYEIKAARECSKCGARYIRRYDMSDGFDIDKPNYCPNCGADMRETGNEEIQETKK